MTSINFDNGIREYAVNGDENNIIRINVTDFNILTRAEQAKDKIDSYIEQVKGVEQPTAEILSQIDKQVRETIDFVFGSDVSSHAFGEVNCVSVVSGGVTLAESFLTALMPEITKEVSKAKAKKIEKYLVK